MKKFLYISFVVLAVLATSCTKEEFKPIVESAGAPVWKSSRTETTPSSFDPSSTTNDNGSGITDPNNDDDSNRKRKTNN